MERNYTKAVRQGFFDLIENETVEVWQNLDRSVAMIKSGKWREHYKEVVSKYRFSSRFAIMRILFEKATGLPLTKTDEQALSRGFSVAGIGSFPDITIKHAKKMTDTEVALYKELLLRRAEEKNPELTQEAASLINGILEVSVAGTKCKLSRDQIIRFGHLVDFSLEDMQFLLLRVLGDNEAGFKYSASMDIIDIYGFITHSSLVQMDELKAWYEANTQNISKEEYSEKPIHFTQDMANSLEQTFSGWSPEDRSKKIKKWLLQNAPYLDVKSKAARKVYVHLAMYAYIRATNKSCELHLDVSDILTDNFYNDIETIVFGPDFHDYHSYAVQLLFKNSKPDLQKCDTIASELIYENAEFAGSFSTHETDSQLLYHVPHLEKGKVTSRGTLNKDSKDRIVAILMDRVSPTKSDLLYLLWFVANTHWIGSSADKKASFLNDFLDAASCVLGEALLPEFYPCGILEETMLLSIVLGNEEKSPAMIYESICNTFTNKGTTKKQAGATTTKTPEQKREIAEYFYSHLSEYPKKGAKEACKNACASHFGIGKSSVEIYCDQYVAQYYFDHLGEFLSEDECKKACAEHFQKTTKSISTCCSKYSKGLE